jgi:hypothetical protein
VSVQRNHTVVWGRQVLVGLAIILGSALVAGQGITIPNTFTNFTTSDANQVNANFTAVSANALNRNAGTMLGTLSSQQITPTADATYDLGTGSFRFRDGFFSRNVTIGGTLTTTGVLPAADNTSNLGTSAARYAIGFFGPGAVGAPGVAVGGADRGMWSSGADALEFSTKGIKALGIDSTQFIDSPTQPRAVVWANNTAQSIVNNTATGVQWNTEDTDVGALHDTGSNTSRFTIPTGGDGLYLVFGAARFAAAAVGFREVFWQKNGTTDLSGPTRLAAESANEKVIGTSQLVTLVAGDYVELMALQDSGGALTINGSATRNLTGYAYIVKLW